MNETEELTKSVNAVIKHCNTDMISDGYHTFGELYEHRIELFIALARWYNDRCALDSTSGYSGHYAWRKMPYEGWFILGLNKKEGEQITYHLPESKWDETNFAREIGDAEIEHDGHTSKDILERLKKL